MGKSRSMEHKELKQWLASVGLFIGFFTALMAVILDIQQFNLLRGISVVSLLLFVGVVVWLSFKALNISLRSQFVIIMVIYVLSAGFILWIGTWFAPQSSDWPLKFVTYYAFESEADLEDWGGESQLSDERSFDGEKALKAFLPLSANKETTFYLHWQHEFGADVVLGQVYWPYQEDISLKWAQVCVPFEDWSCTFISTEPGWNTFVLDLSEMETLDGQNSLDNVTLPGIVLQGVLQTANPDLKRAPIYVDALQIYMDGQE